MNNIERLPILRVTAEDINEVEAIVTKEFSLAIILNNE
jgi:hypothetical protein